LFADAEAGNSHRYESVVTLRAAKPIGFMTIRWAHLSYELRPLSFQGDSQDDGRFDVF